MSRQDKQTTEKNARTLRELVRQGDNKNCADCKKNDARWASWNLGVFVCIRCSGIHRSMGTHISKVKSIDLDIWQPEQMESIKKWGNNRANLYWEAHLKAGHVPPDHKIESFIRSKYESRKWVLSDRIPSDPSILERDERSAPPPSNGDDRAGGTERGAYDPPIAGMGKQGRSTIMGVPSGRGGQHPLLSTNAGSSSSRGGATSAMGIQGPTTSATPRATKMQNVNLLDDDFGAPVSGPSPTTTSAARPSPTATTTAPPPAPGNRPTATPVLGNPVSSPAKPSPISVPSANQPRATPSAKPAPGAGLFDLDFKPPSNAASNANKTSNRDIMSLFSSGSSTAQMNRPNIPLTSPGFASSSSPFGDFTSPTSTAPPQHQQRQPSFSSSSNYNSNPAIYGQQGSSNAPPTYQPNPQASYATWTGSSGVTSNAAGPVAGLSSGFDGMNLGGDPWSSPATSAPKPRQNSGSQHFMSSQDVWGNNSAPAQSNGYAAGGGFGSLGPAISAAQTQPKKLAEEDPFQNIWK